VIRRFILDLIIITELENEYANDEDVHYEFLSKPFSLKPPYNPTTNTIGGIAFRTVRQ